MTATESPSGHAYIPGGRTWRAADLSVLIVLVLGLICGTVLHQSNVNATDMDSFEGLSFAVPKGAIAQTTDDGYRATAKSGLVVRVQRADSPPSADDGAGTLAAARALQLGKQRTLFQIAETTAVQAAGRDAEQLSYQYVASSSQFFAGGLRLIEGNELLIPDGDTYYAVSLEGPSDRRAELDALWPRIQSSIRVEGER